MHLEYQLITDEQLVTCIGADMDWKLDQQRRSKIQALLKNESIRKNKILGEIERDFTHIFGEKAGGIFSAGDDESGGKVMGKEVSASQDNA